MGRSMRNRPDPACVFSKQSATKTDRALIFAVDIRWKQLMDSGTLLEEEEEDEEESTTWRYLYKSFSLLPPPPADVPSVPLGLITGREGEEGKCGVGSRCPLFHPPQRPTRFPLPLENPG